LRSPAIVRDENGQPTLDISTALKARLGWKEEEPFEIETYQHAEVVGGFNRTWGLPLPQVTAIAAGSVFEIKADVEAKKLVQLQESGIGERRAEGFGRVTVTLSLPKIERDEQWHTVAAKVEETQTSTGLAYNKTADLMVKRLARKSLDEKVIHTARQMTEEYMSRENKVTVPNSQLSRWRAVIRTAIENKNLTGLQKFLTESEGKTGWKKMEKARVKPEVTSQRLTEWMKEWIVKPDTLQKALKLDEDAFKKLGENAFILDDKLNLEYRLRLLDAVLAVMAKKNGGSNE
jgi:CRISPR-associated protein Csx10